jgi:hypothetical protein
MAEPRDTGQRINLEPALDALQGELIKGKLVRIDPDDERLTGEVLEFQYNPETITRSRSGKWDPRKKRKEGSIASPQDVRSRSGQGSAALLAESETIALKLVFDATEAILDSRPEAYERGVLPQLALLELISLGRDVDKQKKKKDGPRPIRPDELLLVLGEAQRIFPCVMTSLTITEQKYTPQLVPIRAEADIKLNVLEPTEQAYSKWIGDAFEQVLAARLGNLPFADAGDAALSTIEKALKPDSAAAES